MTFEKMPRGGNLCIKLISIFLIPSFMLTNIAYAAPAQQPSKTSSSQIVPTNPESIIVPREYGLVKTKFSGKSDRLVIHIQDAHCNYEAQSNIVKILDGLYKNYDVKLISVEGADGNIDTSWFKAFPDDEVRKEVADYFMKKGEITGPEFISITTDYDLKLFGAETRSYYIDNLNAFTSSYPLKDQTEKYLNTIKSALNKLKTYIYSEDLRLMDAKYQDYESKKLAFNDYVKFLQAEADKAKINLRAYDNFFKLISVLVYEKKIDFNVTDKERGSLIDELSKKIDKDALTELVNKSLQFKSGKISSADYYNYLKSLAIANSIDMSKEYPNLYNYIIYNSVYSKIENESLFSDIKKLESDIKEKLFTNDDQRTLEKLSRHIDILLGLVNIKLLNGDYEYFEKNRADFSHEVFSDFIKKKAIQYGLAYEVDDPSDAVAQALPKLEDFYSIATKRDKALVDNTLKAMDNNKTKVAVLITGGFHSDGMTKLLEKEGVSYMVVCPSITKDVPTPYIQILTNQRTPIQDILVTPAHASETGDKTEAKSMLAPAPASFVIGLKEGELDKFPDAGGLRIRIDYLETGWIHVFLTGQDVDGKPAQILVGGIPTNIDGYVNVARKQLGGVSMSVLEILSNFRNQVALNYRPTDGVGKLNKGELLTKVDAEIARLSQTSREIKEAMERKLAATKEKPVATPTVETADVALADATAQAAIERASAAFKEEILRILETANSHVIAGQDLVTADANEVAAALKNRGGTPGDLSQQAADGSTLTPAQAHKFNQVLKGFFTDKATRLKTGQTRIIPVQVKRGDSIVTINVIAHDGMIDAIESEGLPANIHPSRGGEEFQHELVQTQLDSYFYDNLTAEEIQTIGNHELSHIEIHNGLEFPEKADPNNPGKKYKDNPTFKAFLAAREAALAAAQRLGKTLDAGKFEEYFVNTLPGCDTTQISGKLRELLKIRKKAYAAIAAVHQNLPNVLSEGGMRAALEDIVAMDSTLHKGSDMIKQLFSYVAVTSTQRGWKNVATYASDYISHRAQLDAISEIREIPTREGAGFGVYIFVSSTQVNADYWQKRFEQGRGTVLPKGAIVISVTESNWQDPNGASNGFGTFNGWLQAQKKYTELYPDLAKKRSLMDICREQGAVMMHMAGKATRMQTVAMDNKSAVRLPGTVMIDGKPEPLTVGEAVIMNFGLNVRPGRLTLAWGDQNNIPSTNISSPNTHLAEIFGVSVPIKGNENFLTQKGLLAPAGTENPGDVLQREKLPIDEIIRRASGKPDAMMSLGFNSFRWELLDAALKEFDPELVNSGRTDTGLATSLNIDSEFWGPYTSTEEEYVAFMKGKRPATISESDWNAKIRGHWARVRRIFERAEVQANQTRPADNKITAFEPSGERGVMQAITYGEKGATSEWWDWGMMNEYYDGLMLLLTEPKDYRDQWRAERIRRFFGLPKRDQWTATSQLHGTTVTNSIVMGSKINSGRIVNSIVIGVSAEYLNVENAIVIGAKVFHLTAKGHNVVTDLISETGEEVILEKNEILACHYLPDVGQIRMYESFDNDIGGDYKKVVKVGNHPANPMSAKDASDKLKEVSAERRAELRTEALKRIVPPTMTKTYSIFKRMFARSTFGDQLVFGTSGIREVVKFLEDLKCFAIGKAILSFFKQVKQPDTVALAGDFRPSTPRIILQQIIAALEMGKEVVYGGNIPTPAIVYYGMNRMEGRIPSCMGTASHCPVKPAAKEQNGIKPNVTGGEVLKEDERLILKQVREFLELELMKPESERIFDSNGMLKDEAFLSDQQRALLARAQEIMSRINDEPRKMFIERYRAFGKIFDDNDRMVFLQHMAVGRNMIMDIFAGLGAVNLDAQERQTDWVEGYVVDTEDVQPKLQEAVSRIQREKKDSHENIRGIFTVDGDSDRPAIFDENGNFVYGDKVGYLTCEYIKNLKSSQGKKMFVAVTATVSGAVISRLESLGIEVFKVKVGSPYVVKAMNDRMELAKKNGEEVICCGFERNGGFLLGSDIVLDNGNLLKALPTRDSLLPLIAVFHLAKKDNMTVGELVKNRFSGQYASSVWSGLIEAGTKDPLDPTVEGICNQYTAMMGQGIMKYFSPLQFDITEVIFNDDGSIKYLQAGAWNVLDPNKGALPADEQALFDRMQRVKKELEGYFGEDRGFTGGIERINYLDGVRMIFKNKEITHMRPSGNAPQWRVYTEATTLERAKQITDYARQMTDGKRAIYPQIIEQYLKDKKQFEGMRIVPRSNAEMKETFKGIYSQTDDKWTTWEMAFGKNGEHKIEEGIEFPADNSSLTFYRKTTYDLAADTTLGWLPKPGYKGLTLSITRTISWNRVKGTLTCKEQWSDGREASVILAGSEAWLELGKGLDKNIPMGKFQNMPFPVMSDKARDYFKAQGIAWFDLFDVSVESEFTVEAPMWERNFNFKKPEQASGVSLDNADIYTTSAAAPATLPLSSLATGPGTTEEDEATRAARSKMIMTEDLIARFVMVTEDGKIYILPDNSPGAQQEFVAGLRSILQDLPDVDAKVAAEMAAIEGLVTSKANTERAASKMRANIALLPYVAKALNTNTGEISVNMNGDIYIVVNDNNALYQRFLAAKQSLKDRGRHDATYMMQRGLIPLELISTAKRPEFMAAQNEAVYNMLHVVTAEDGGKLHLATQFPGAALYAGTNIYTTTGSHFQGRGADIKYVEQGTGIQIIAYEQTGGEWMVKMIPLYPGSTAISIPGTIDVVVNLGGLLFTDRSCPETVSDADVRKIAIGLNLSARFVEALQANDLAFADKLGPGLASGMPIVVTAGDSGEINATLNPAFADKNINVKVEVVNGFNLGYTDKTGKPALVAASVNTVFNPLAVGEFNAAYRDLIGSSVVQNALDQLGVVKFIGKLTAKQPVENITESLPAVKLADKVSRGQALEFEPYFKTDKEKYTWGQRFALSLQSGILKLVMNFMSSERFEALMKKLGIKAVSIISERWIAAGPVEWALPQEILARYAEQVFGREHIASYGARLGVTAKHLTSSVPLSIQKHSFAEMIIVQEGEGQKMYVGFKKDVTEEEVLAALRAGTPEEIMNVVENLKPGDVYIIPANMPHAYGAVNVIEVKAVTPEEDKVGTDSFYDRLKLDDDDKLKVTAIISQVSQANIGKSEPEVAQAIADALVAAELVRNGKDVLTKSNEEVRRIIADIKRAGYLKATNPESLKLAPQATRSGSSFASVVRTGGFVSERFNIAAGQSLPSSAEALGKPHTLFVTEGSVTWKDSSGATETLEAGEERLVPANAKAYTLTAGNGTAVVYSAYKPSAAEALKAIIPNSELAKGELPGAETSARTEIVLRESGATFERIEVKGETQIDRWLTGRPVTIKVEKGAGVAIFNSVGKQVATVESGESVDIAADQDGFVIKPTAGETPVVTVTYLHNEEEAATFASIEALRSNLGAIRGKLEGKTLEIRMTKKTADLLYRDGGDANTPGSQAYERAKFAKFMSQYIGADVRIMIRDDWKDLSGPSDDKTVPVAWITQDEIQALQSTETLKTIATSFRKMPLSSALMNQMAKSKGFGWSCVMELQANSILLAATNPEDIKERNDIATSLMRVMNTMIDRPVEAASDLWPLLPAGDNFQLISNFADLIKRLLITRPMTPFRPESELNSRRLLLWSA